MKSEMPVSLRRGVLGWRWKDWETARHHRQSQRGRTRSANGASSEQIARTLSDLPEDVCPCLASPDYRHHLASSCIDQRAYHQPLPAASRVLRRQESSSTLNYHKMNDTETSLTLTCSIDSAMMRHCSSPTPRNIQPQEKNDDATLLNPTTTSTTSSCTASD